jgi:hypothetical protein
MNKAAAEGSKQFEKAEKKKADDAGKKAAAGAKAKS